MHDDDLARVVITKTGIKAGDHHPQFHVNPSITSTSYMFSKFLEDSKPLKDAVIDPNRSVNNAWGKLYPMNITMARWVSNG